MTKRYLYAFSGELLGAGADYMFDVDRQQSVEPQLVVPLTDDRQTELVFLPECPEGFESLSVRAALMSADDQQFALLSKASQLATWEEQNKFCSRCGDPLTMHAQDVARCCDSCGLHAYPKIAPCIIVLVHDGDRFLLAHHARYGHDRKLYSTLAGFIEAGETPEQTVAREVMEEVGLTVTDIEYQLSQAWPFPHQLMLGYFARYKGGDIVPEPGEIHHADWFQADALPEIPPPFTIAGRLIARYIESLQS